MVHPASDPFHECQLSRSVHNTRIERLWYDVTNGFGRKWKQFFLDLEVNHGLNPTSPAHIWLLHHLFLDAINQDALQWAEAWNTHRLHVRGEPAASPRQLFLFGMYQHGPRGIEHLIAQPEEDEETVDDLDEYGIDWDVAGDDTLMAHLLEHNPHEDLSDNPFTSATTPAHLSHVPCDSPTSLLTVAQVRDLDSFLSQTVDLSSRSMLVRRLVWQEALNFCAQLFNVE